MSKRNMKKPNFLLMTVYDVGSGELNWLGCLIIGYLFLGIPLLALFDGAAIFAVIWALDLVLALPFWLLITWSDYVSFMNMYREQCESLGQTEKAEKSEKEVNRTWNLLRIAAVAFLCFLVVMALSECGSSDGGGNYDYDEPITAEEAASQYYYDSDGHIRKKS